MKPRDGLKQKKFIGIDSIMPSGKYKGLPAVDLAKNKPDYILFINSQSGSVIKSELLAEAIKNIPPDFEEELENGG